MKLAKQKLLNGLVNCLGTAAVILALTTSVYAANKPEMTDYRISQAIEDAFITDQGVPGNWINVLTNDGIVMLSGTVDNILAKDRAARIAETVRGVRSVVNNINVNPMPRKDSDIKSDVEDAFLWDPVTESWELTTEVNDGVVTISGYVDSWQEKQLAAKVAKGVRGVKGINNQIEVVYKEQRPDGEIYDEIKSALDWNALVDNALIDVEVNDGVVTLSGTVGSAAEKRFAIADAWVVGVEDVNAEQLEVETWARDERFRKNKYVYKEDSKIEEAVNDGLLYHPRVNMFDISVESNNGRVILTGVVDNLKAKRVAEQIARNTVGVWDVKNNIKVRPDTPSDEKIENNIEQALLMDPYVNRFDINVSVINKIAYLSGEVETYFEKAQADDVASRIYGVTEVKNNIDVIEDFEAFVYDPYVDDYWYFYDDYWAAYPASLYFTTTPDWEIREDIQEELWWSPFVDSDNITVTVEDGVANLEGTVQTWNEWRSAQKNAFEGGAVAVNNDLEVTYGPEQ